MVVTMSIELAEGILLGGEAPVLVAGPCVVESERETLEIATELRRAAASAGLPLVFKASFDKANRTSIRSFRSIGRESALAALARVRDELGLPVLTDVHEPRQVEEVAAVADVLQVPAFLCRQTDLLLAAGRSGRPVNLKKGPFMAPDDMRYALEKVHGTGNRRVFLTERGTFFGYHDLVVDMRALPLMRRLAPVIFDVTHSLQRPGGGDGSSGGRPELAADLARGAAAVGVDGFFVETHPDPPRARSDAESMLQLAELPGLLEALAQVWRASRPFHQPPQPRQQR
jgi:2-dehydro-3-deoxyphosphooctonate aldolase (KDO 8-P synthase)